MGSRSMPSTFKKVFENDYGTLYQNPVKVEHDRQPLRAEVSLPLLILIAIVGFLLVVGDFYLPQRAWYRLIAGGLGTVVVALCLAPLASAAVSELRNPPAAPPPGQNGPPGFAGPDGPGPGFGGPNGQGPGFGGQGPGFDAPGIGGGQFVAQAFLRDAHPSNAGSVTLQEFKTLAGRWWDAWNGNHDGSLSVDEFSTGIANVLQGSSGRGSPMGPPDGPPGGPAAFVGQKIYTACDANNDGKLTREEMVNGFEKLFRQWDVDSKNSLDAAKIGNGLDQLMGPPPAY